MSSYSEFAKFYDDIMGDRSPDVEWVRGYIDRFLPSANSLLELGCGTGAVLVGLAKNLTVAGVDRSPEMLTRAADNLAASGLSDVRLVEADMTSFSLGTTFDVVICIFDTLNHLPRWESWLALFERAHEHLADGGLFLFDVNTTGRLRRLWHGPAFAEDFGENIVLMDVAPARGEIPAAGELSDWRVRIFERLDDGLFRLHDETIPELGVPLERIRLALAEHFDVLDEADLDGGMVSDASARVYFACRHR